jgi:hypothetical protein
MVPEPYGFTARCRSVPLCAKAAEVSDTAVRTAWQCWPPAWQKQRQSGGGNLGGATWWWQRGGSNKVAAAECGGNGKYIAGALHWSVVR